MTHVQNPKSKSRAATFRAMLGSSDRIPGIPESLVSEVLGLMQDGGGWERIAVRLVSLYAFLNQAEAPAKPAIELIP